MAVKKITKRWLFNSFGVIVVIILVVEIIFAIGISNYYYNSVRMALSSRADNVSSRFRQYDEDIAVTDFPSEVQRYVAAYSQSDNKVELMTIDADGVIRLTSSGFEPENKTAPPDYQHALASPESTGYYVGSLNNERVMALTLLLPASIQEQSVTAVRMVTALDRVDRQIAVLVFGMLLLGILVLAMVLFSSSYFISSIVNPIGEVGQTARRIAQGDFGARLQKRTDDEIGELCDIINYMAGELATAEKLKNDFISSVSHELRTPLTAIQGWGETLLADDGEDKEILRKGMGVIISETGRLSQMVEELLDFSRMQSGRLRLVKGKMDAMAELSEAVLMYTERARREGIALEYEDSGLIAPVYGDRNKLRQVFVNIIDNAIKYSDSGGTVTISPAVKGGRFTVTVSDIGIGIREEDLPQIKQKFFKANSTRRGSGIGLAVADEIVTRHDGSLEVASRYRSGTTVTVTLPVYKGQDESVRVSGDEEDEAPGTRHTHST